ncbi:hypothetical protein [Streptomyces sp. A0592]|uniref:hypothetical protein n=1 Tax=Streptomyces sp. A0592 TaxID=2563099 RepID=UPI00109EDDBA|nr:hypothetical protein [Streptomyces sp. A0592]THA79763.1 hypothetical protein E6U81_31670 [Streptomyces sp. A0592]
MTTADALLDRLITHEQDALAIDARRVAELAARIADNPPSATRSTSGDVTRLSQYVTELLRRTAKLEATIEAAQLMKNQNTAH